MNDILKMVYGNQKEVKLESQIIELAGMKDLDSLIVEANKYFDAGTSNISQVKTIINQSKDDFNNSVNKYDECLKTANSIVDKIKSLDVEVPTILNTKISWLKNNIKEGNAKIKSLQNAIKSI